MGNLSCMGCISFEDISFGVGNWVGRGGVGEGPSWKWNEGFTLWEVGRWSVGMSWESYGEDGVD